MLSPAQSKQHLPVWCQEHRDEITIRTANQKQSLIRYFGTTVGLDRQVQIPSPRSLCVLTTIAAILPKKRGFTCHYPGQLVITWAHSQSSAQVRRSKKWQIRNHHWVDPFLLPLLKVAIIVVQYLRIVTEALEGAQKVERGCGAAAWSVLPGLEARPCTRPICARPDRKSVV